MFVKIMVLAGDNLDNPMFVFSREDQVYPEGGDPLDGRAGFTAAEKLLDDLDEAKASIQAQAQALQRIAGEGPSPGS